MRRPGQRADAGEAVELAARTWTEVERQPPALLVVPVGSTEQHGPHLPLSTDTDIAVALCTSLAARRSDVAVAPAVAYGSSGEHAAFPGTLSIGREALRLLLVELVRSATRSVPRVLLVNAHGGNAVPVAAAVRLLRVESRDVRGWSPRAGGDAHAGRTETSLQLALGPARVREHRQVRGDCRPLGALLPALAGGRLRELSASGVLGDPAGATAEEGRLLLDRLVDDLAGTVLDWLDGDRPTR